MALAAMMSLLVIVGGVALALDRLWLDSAKTELEAAVEAAALRGGQLLASDDLLRVDADADAQLERARQEAGRKLAGSLAKTLLLASRSSLISRRKETFVSGVWSVANEPAKMSLSRRPTDPTASSFEVCIRGRVTIPSRHF